MSKKKGKDIRWALEVVRDELFGLGQLDHAYLVKVKAMSIIQPILESAADKEEIIR